MSNYHQTSVARHLTILKHCATSERWKSRASGTKVCAASLRRATLKAWLEDAGRLRKMLAFIDAAESFEELSVPPNFGLHELTGDRKKSWSMTVTRNWRMTFGLNDEGALIDMDLEDYHGA